MPRLPCFCATVIVTNPARIERVATLLNRLPLVQPRSGPAPSCAPPLAEVFLRLAFYRSRRGPPVAVARDEAAARARAACNSTSTGTANRTSNHRSNCPPKSPKRSASSSTSTHRFDLARELPPAAAVLRALHAAVAVGFLYAIAYVWWCALTARRGRRLDVAIALLAVEGAAVAADGGDCPLGPSAGEGRRPRAAVRAGALPARSPSRSPGPRTHRLSRRVGSTRAPPRVVPPALARRARHGRQLTRRPDMFIPTCVWPMRWHGGPGRSARDRYGCFWVVGRTRRNLEYPQRGCGSPSGSRVLVGEDACAGRAAGSRKAQPAAPFGASCQEGLDPDRDCAICGPSCARGMTIWCMRRYGGARVAGARDGRFSSGSSSQSRVGSRRALLAAVDGGAVASL